MAGTAPLESMVQGTKDAMLTASSGDARGRLVNSSEGPTHVHALRSSPHQHAVRVTALSPRPRFNPTGPTRSQHKLASSRVACRIGVCIYRTFTGHLSGIYRTFTGRW
jgi:hypothetical protein